MIPPSDPQAQRGPEGDPGFLGHAKIGTFADDRGAQIAGANADCVIGAVADVEIGLARLTFKNRFNGRPCINLSIAKETDADARAVRAAIDVAMNEFLATEGVPDGVELTTSVDTTRILDNRISVLVDNLAFGIVLVFGVLWLLIGARNSMLAIIGIPFSFLLGFAVLSQFGMSVNAITLFSLMLVSGMVVDDTMRRSRAWAGWSHSKVTPTTSSPAPRPKRISVVEGRRETIRCGRMEDTVGGPARARA